MSNKFSVNGQFLRISELLDSWQLIKFYIYRQISLKGSIFCRWLSIMVVFEQVKLPKNYVKYQNFTWLSGMEFLWERIVFPEFWANRLKPRKLRKITVFHMRNCSRFSINRKERPESVGCFRKKLQQRYFTGSYIT